MWSRVNCTVVDLFKAKKWQFMKCFRFFFALHTHKIFLVNVQGLISVTLFSTSDCLHFHSFIKVVFEVNGSRLSGLVLTKCFMTRCSKLPAWTRCHRIAFSGQSLKEGKKIDPYLMMLGVVIRDRERQRKNCTEKVLPFVGVFFFFFFFYCWLAPHVWLREHEGEKIDPNRMLLNPGC